MSRNVSLQTIEDFLAQKRIAMVGVSHDPRDFSVQLFEEFCRRGYDMVPVNPAVSEVSGKPCMARVQDIQPHVDAAILMTSAAVTETVVRDCAEAGIRLVWMYSAGNQGSVSEGAVDFCHAHNMQVIPGECPLMFWPDSGAGHRLHGLILKLFRRYPRRTAA